MEQISGSSRVRTEEVIQRVQEERNILHRVNRRTSNLIGHILNRNCPVAYPGIFFGGGGSTNSVEDRENGDLGALAP
jgi:hypothetical protein